MTGTNKSEGMERNNNAMSWFETSEESEVTMNRMKKEWKSVSMSGTNYEHDRVVINGEDT